MGGGGREVADTRPFKRALGERHAGAYGRKEVPLYEPDVNNSPRSVRAAKKLADCLMG